MKLAQDISSFFCRKATLVCLLCVLPYSVVWLYAKQREVSPSKLKSQGLQAASQGDHVQAVKLFGRAIELDVRDHEACWRRAASLLSMGGGLFAVRDMQTAVEIYPRSDYFVSLGQACASVGQHGDAINAYDEAIARNPLCSVGYWLRGNSWAAGHEYEKAVMDYDAALAIEPNNANAMLTKGNALEKLGLRKEALIVYSKGLEIAPSRFDLKQAQQRVLSGRGSDYDQE